jgi:hypothetical protein
MAATKLTLASTVPKRPDAQIAGICGALMVLQPPIIVASIDVRTAAVSVCHSASLTILTRPFSSAVIMPPNARQKAAPTARLSDTSMMGYLLAT